MVWQADREHEHITAELLVASARAADVVVSSAHPPTTAEAEAAEAAGGRMSGLARFRIALDDARTELLSRERRESGPGGPGPLALPAAAASDAAPLTSVALHPSAASAVTALSLGAGGGASRTTDVSVRRRRGTALGSLRARLNLGDSP